MNALSKFITQKFDFTENSFWILITYFHIQNINGHQINIFGLICLYYPKYLFNLGLICISKESTFIMSFDVVPEFRDTTQKTVLVISIRYSTKYTFLHWMLAFYTVKLVVLTFQCRQQHFEWFFCSKLWVEIKYLITSNLPKQRSNLHCSDKLATLILLHDDVFIHLVSSTNI